MDKRLLEALIYKFQGGPCGLKTLATALGEDESTLEEVHEPFLIMNGFLKRTPRGRVALPPAYQKIGADPPSPTGKALFSNPDIPTYDSTPATSSPHSSSPSLQ